MYTLNSNETFRSHLHTLRKAPATGLDGGINEQHLRKWVLKGSKLAPQTGV